MKTLFSFITKLPVMLAIFASLALTLIMVAFVLPCNGIIWILEHHFGVVYGWNRLFVALGVLVMWTAPMMILFGKCCEKPVRFYMKWISRICSIVPGAVFFTMAFVECVLLLPMSLALVVARGYAPSCSYLVGPRGHEIEFGLVNPDFAQWATLVNEPIIRFFFEQTQDLWRGPEYFLNK